MEKYSILYVGYWWTGIVTKRLVYILHDSRGEMIHPTQFHIIVEIFVHTSAIYEKYLFSTDTINKKGKVVLRGKVAFTSVLTVPQLRPPRPPVIL